MLPPLRLVWVLRTRSAVRMHSVQMLGQPRASRKRMVVQMQMSKLPVHQTQRSFLSMLKVDRKLMFHLTQAEQTLTRVSQQRSQKRTARRPVARTLGVRTLMKSMTHQVQMRMCLQTQMLFALLRTLTAFQKPKLKLNYFCYLAQKVLVERPLFVQLYLGLLLVDTCPQYS